MHRWKGFGPLIMMGIALLLLTSVPAAAQGKGKGRNSDDRPRIDRLIGSQDRYDRAQNRRDQAQRGKRVPPGWCIGRGNPHNTRENCGYRDSRRYEGRYDDRSRIDRRSDYDREHVEFHRYLDRKYAELAARRPRDLEYQRRLRAERAREHERWHQSMRRPH